MDNFALPLTIETHDSVNASMLFPTSSSRPESIKEEDNVSASNQGDDITLRGLLNLFVLLLVTYNIRFVIDDLRKNDFVMFETVSNQLKLTVLIGLINRFFVEIFLSFIVQLRSVPNYCLSDRESFSNYSIKKYGKFIKIH